MKVLSIVQSFPENVVTLSKFRVFAENPKYDYRVFCWKSDPEAWDFWAGDLRQHRSKIIVAATASIFHVAFWGELARYCWFLLRHPGLSVRVWRHHFTRVGFLRATYRLLEDYKILDAQPQILHFEFGTLALGKIYLKDFLRCKIVVSFRGYDLNYFQLENPQAFQPLWLRADGFHFLGQDLLERAQRRGFPASKLYRIIPPAVDLEKFRPEPKPVPTQRSPVHIVSLSRLVWKKGLEFGLLAFSEFLKKGGSGTYHLIGKGPEKEKLMFYAHELGIAERLVFHGKCRPGQVREILGQADIFLHPAISEGFCNAAMEAQAMQLPVVCFAADGLRENVEDGVTGFIAEIWDWEKLAEYLHELWQNPEKRHQMGLEGRKRMADLFGLEKQFAAFDEFYQAVWRDE